jgi:hypothetical protein
MSLPVCRICGGRWTPDSCTNESANRTAWGVKHKQYSRERTCRPSQGEDLGVGCPIVTHLDDFARVEDEDMVVIRDSLQSVRDRDDLFGETNDDQRLPR